MEKEILNKKNNGWLSTDENLKQQIYSFSEDYIKFLNECYNIHRLFLVPDILLF